MLSDLNGIDGPFVPQSFEGPVLGVTDAERAQNAASAVLYLGHVGDQTTEPISDIDFHVSHEGYIGLPSHAVATLAETVVGDETAVVWVRSPYVSTNETDDTESEALALDFEAAMPIDIIAGHLTLDQANYRLLIDGEAVHLPLKIFKVLQLLVHNAGVTVTRQRFYKEIWDDTYGVLDKTKTLNVHVKRLREKLGDAHELISTVRGVGYRFDYPDAPALDS